MPPIRLRTAPAAAGTEYRRLILLAVLALAAVALAAVIAYRAGEHRISRGTDLHGVAYVGDQQAAVRVHGAVYAIPAGVAWVDRSGTRHESSWPACLSPVGARVPVSFTATSTTVGGAASNQVVLVRCR